MNTYTTIVGMEIHVELSTQSKMFCGCKNDPFAAPKPNIYTCPVCLGMPGGIPVPNKKAIEWAIKLGLALGCTINTLSKFDRKNYFYPDLAKGYQISQYDLPFSVNGVVDVEGFPSVRIHRVHLEEDTGKLQHVEIDGKKVSAIDFNRSGVPLVEIVTEADIRSGDHAKAFLKKLHQIIRYTEISGADMEKGSMRLEPNISVTKEVMEAHIDPAHLPPYKVEVKNINSFSFVKKAIDFEVKRHIELLEKGEIPKQETRGYVEATSSTVSQRSKEDAMDYRYFPEPDIPPIHFTEAQIEAIRGTLPELPDAKVVRFTKEFSLSQADSLVLTETKEKADYVESCIALIEANKTFAAITPKMLANAIINRKQDGGTVSPQDLLEEIQAKAQANTVDISVITGAVGEVLKAQAKAVEEYKSGKTGVLMFIVGQVKKELQGKGDAEIIKAEILKHIA